MRSGIMHTIGVKRYPPYTEMEKVEFESPLYLEYNEEYKSKCINNLKEKGITI